MKKKDLEKIKGMTVIDLERDLKDKRDKLWSLMADISAGKNKNVRAGGVLKKDIARVMTVLNIKKAEK